MTRSKIYKFDDEFKRKARAHQFKFRDEILRVSYDDKNPQVMLTPEAAKDGLIFYDGYRDYIRKKVPDFRATALYSNMLRSEHIPFNIFTPMELDKSGAVNLFNKIIGGGISLVKDIKIEFAGNENRSAYLNDGTSFDVYIEYVAVDGRNGGIGIEVKYTEQGYRLGKKEKEDILKPDGPYKLKTERCGFYKDDLTISRFITDNDLRQIWRNHILGFSMIDIGQIAYFHHIHLYPKGNIHFAEHALPDYKKLLTDKGRESFKDICFEELFELMKTIFKTEEQTNWINYLQRRYIVDNE